MSLAPLDWLILAGYFVLSAAIGLAYTRRAGRSVSEYFVSGRSVPWWLAGTSMVATTFAADTPLAVTGMVAENGVAGNWLWWNMVMSGMLTVFFYARLWRRAEVLTDVEFTELRYSGRPAAILRGFRALYMALPINLIVIGWVNLAMLKILDVTLGIAPVQALGVMFVVTMAYSVLSGLWGVLVTDFVQFGIAMGGSIVLAVYAVDAVGGIDGLVARLPQHYGSAEAALAVFPRSDAAWMPLTAFLAYLAVQWWATSYPGAEPGGGGYVAQRIFSARTERDGVLATLWFNIAHYAVRPWPWILTALSVVVLYPGLEDPATGYVRAVVDLLPTGFRGLMIAAFAAAYMSTIATQLNWGASYLVNDLYLRFVNPRADERSVVRLSRLSTALIFILGSGVTWVLHQAGSIEGAWRIIIALGAGTGLVYILRWYWWRINPWSEISAMAAALMGFVVFTGTGIFNPVDPLEGAYLMLANTVVTTAVWLAVTFLTAPTEEERLVRFYRRVRPGGRGWRRVQEAAGFPGEPIPGGALSWVNWVAGVVSVYAALFGVGRLIFGRVGEAALYLVLAGAAFALIARNLGREEPEPRQKEPSAHSLAEAVAAK
ncbi:MAG TPA: sodium:solute symporter family protein [Longimicrobiaceae bacterium]|nr:sodium:solute symporter family protein [Longimicrobiaceae bacterium]